ncbi:MAG TPA: ParB/RepB/Spo0J family partition protein [Planctomycetota bacterium]|nr:ParB/RepB/Spo0J family partition protein [Planctomycetota bacterium]
MSKGKLGRGLDFLLSKENPVTPDDQQAILQLKVSEIHPNRNQPRQEFDNEALSDLMDSIASNGIIQPIVVRRDADGYELIAGERRWRAATRLNMEYLPAIIRQADDAESLQIALIENIQRQDLNPIEKARAYKELIVKFGLTQDQAATRLGMNRSSMANMLRLLELPEDIQHLVSRGTLSMGHARAILGINDIEEQRRLAKRIEKESLSVRHVEKYVAEYANKVNSPGNVLQPTPKPPHIRDIEDRLRIALGTRVTIVEHNGSGKIVIDFFTPDDFDRVLQKLT